MTKWCLGNYKQRAKIVGSKLIQINSVIVIYNFAKKGPFGYDADEFCHFLMYGMYILVDFWLRWCCLQLRIAGHSVESKKDMHALFIFIFDENRYTQ